MVYVLMSCAMVVADRCKVETADGLAVEPGREEPTLKVGRGEHKKLQKYPLRGGGLSPLSILRLLF